MENISIFSKKVLESKGRKKETKIGYDIFFFVYSFVIIFQTTTKWWYICDHTEKKIICDFFFFGSFSFNFCSVF